MHKASFRPNQTQWQQFPSSHVFLSMASVLRPLQFGPQGFQKKWYVTQNDAVGSWLTLHGHTWSLLLGHVFYSRVRLHLCWHGLISTFFDEFMNISKSALSNWTQFSLSPGGLSCWNLCMLRAGEWRYDPQKTGGGSLYCSCPMWTNSVWYVIMLVIFWQNLYWCSWNWTLHQLYILRSVDNIL